MGVKGVGDRDLWILIYRVLYFYAVKKNYTDL